MTRAQRVDAQRVSAQRVSSERIREAQGKLAKTQLRSTLCLSPTTNAGGELAGVLGDHLLDLMGMFYDRVVCRRANVAVTEFVTNALTNAVDPAGELRVDISIDSEALVVEVSNKVDDPGYAAVAERVQRINESADVRALLRDTINFRRARRLPGGLGLLRLSSENKFVLSVRRDGEYMTIRAEHALEAQ
jgi:hypothetical protein